MNFRKSIVVVIFLVIGVSYIIYRIVLSEKNDQNALGRTRFCYNETFDKEDSTLFKASELSKMKSIVTIKSDLRNNIKFYDYNNIGRIHLIKIDLINDIPMDQFIWFREVETCETDLHSYYYFSKKGKFDFLVLGEKIPQVSKIIFSLTGDGNHIEKNVYNKSFVSYYLPVSTFSLRYGEKSSTDIFFGGQETLFGGRNTYPLMITFYKIHKSLYILIFIPKEDEMNLNGNLFGKIMNDNSIEN